jgi:hypothetical protein
MASKKILVDVQVRDLNASKTINNTADAVDRLGNSMKRNKKPYKENTANAGLNNAILMETSRLASDASFGFMAIGNNLSQLINLFQMSAKSAGGVVAAFRKLISLQSLLLIGVQLLISFLPRMIKKYEQASKSANALGAAMRDATASMQGKIGSIKALTKAIDDGDLSYNQRVDLTERLKKETGLSNIELDANNKLTEESNELIDKSIEKMILEAQAKAIIALMDEANKKAYKEIAEAREKESSALNKFLTLMSTILEPIVKAWGKLKKAVTGFFEYLENQGVVGQLILNALFGVSKGIMDEYGDAIDGADQKQKRKQETDKKVKEVQDGLNKSNNEYITALKEIFENIEKLNIVEKDNLEVKHELDLFTQMRIDSIRAEIKANNELERIQKRIFVQDLAFEAGRGKTHLNRMTQINSEKEAVMASIKESGAFHGKIKQASLEAETFYNKLIKAEADKLMQEAFLDNYQVVFDTFTTTYDNQLIALESNYSKQIAAAEGNKDKQVELEAKLAEETDKIKRKQFKVDKAAKMAQALVDTYLTGVKAYGSQLIIGDPTSPIRAQIAQGVALAAGFLNVANIARQKYQSPVMAGSGITAGGSTGGFEVAAPDFNVVGASETSQIGQALGLTTSNLTVDLYWSEVEKMNNKNRINTKMIQT